MTLENLKTPTQERLVDSPESRDRIRRELWALVKACGTQKAVSDAYNISISALNQVLSGKREPSERMCAIVGWRLKTVTVYERGN